MMLIAALNPGAAYHCDALEGPRYARFFDRLIRPEAFDAAALADAGTLIVPCRTHPERLKPHWPLFAEFLAGGGTLVAMGETFQEHWIPGVRFHSLETNYWWWLEPGADLGMRLASPAHPLLVGFSKRHVTWHQHGWYDLPHGAEALVVDRDGNAHAYVDETSFGGTLLVTSLDPFYHHGSGFMPSTTLFLDAFLPALRAWTDRAGAGRAVLAHG
jgi:hypothetical protein